VDICTSLLLSEEVDLQKVMPNFVHAMVKVISYLSTGYLNANIRLKLLKII